MDRRAPQRRYLYTLAYLLMAAGGAGAALWPAPSVHQTTATAGELLYVWACFLIGGGLLSAYGSLTDEWIGEYTGLPLLASVFAVYGLSAAIIAVDLRRPESVAGACSLTAIALFLLGRWWEISRLRRATAVMLRERAEREGGSDGREQ